MYDDLWKAPHQARDEIHRGSFRKQNQSIIRSDLIREWHKKPRIFSILKE